MTDQETARKLDSGVYLELACFDVKSLLLADNAGADRTEFCADRTSGGVTPPLCEILYSLPLLQNQVHVMIRPRGGDFIYSDAEFEQMKHEIHTIKSSPGKLAGFVFGILDANGKVDVLRNSELVALAKHVILHVSPRFRRDKRSQQRIGRRHCL
jgi:copper homeostasis protein